MSALLALLSSALWGTGDFMAGWLSRRRSVFAVTGSTQAVGLVVMLAVATVTGSWSVGWGDYVLWGLLSSFAGLGGLLMFYTALASGRMGVVSPIAALGVLVPLSVGLLSGETPAPVQYMGIVLAVVGVVLASGPEVSGATGVRPVLLALGAALGFGSFYVFLSYGAETSTVMTLLVQRTGATVLILAGALIKRSTGDLQRSDIGLVLAIGTFDIAANLTFGIASETGLLSVVSVLGSLYPVVTAILAWAVLKERLAAAQYIGVAVAMIGVVAINAG